MKTGLILLLGAALLTGLFLSRPSAASFEDFLTRRTGHETKTVMLGLFKSQDAQREAKSYDYKDWYLWSTQKKNDRTVYVGLFNTWFQIGNMGG
jgi:hypothetical protein